ncbi:MAG: hypothetical protein AAGB01_09155 [Cyanobacteria bacterium P01_F01_bin.42]
MQRRRYLKYMSALVGGLLLSGLSKSAAASVAKIRFRDLYKRGTTFSSQALNLNGDRVKIRGYMAPPLRAEANFFVLTRLPMSVCPFCEEEADWPDDIALVYVRDRLSVVPWNYPIEVTGSLALGTKTDRDTGFVSRVRLERARYQKAF